MKKLLFVIFIVINVSCQDDKSTYGNYSKLLEMEKFSFYKTGTRLKLQDNFNDLISIDTMLLKPFQLINIEPKEYAVVNLKDFQCRLLGIYRNPNFDLVITNSYTTTAGDGNPIILISTYNKTGKLLSRIEYPIIYQHDYTPIPEQYLILDDQNKISFNLIEKNYEIVDSVGIEVLRYKNTIHSNQDYSIDKKGVIKTLTIK